MTEPNNTTDLFAQIISQDGLTRTIKVEATANRVAQAFEREYRKIQGQVTLRGFRKGRAPISMIKKLYQEEVRQDAVERIINETYPGAVAELKLHVAAHPRIKDFSLTEEMALHYTAEVEVFPEIAAIDMTGLTYASEDTSVSEADVDEVISGLRKRQATYTTLERPAQEGDIVTVDIEVIDDPKGLMSEKHLNNSTVDLGNPRTLKEFREALLGAIAGMVKDATVTYPADYADQTFAGATVKYSFAVTKVTERHLPALDDEFAKAQGGESVADLRAKVLSRLAEQRENDYHQRRNNQLISQVVAMNPVAVPQAMVEQYLGDVVKDLQKRHGAEAIDPDKVREEYHETGVQNMRWWLLSRRLAEIHQIEVLAEDTEKWIERMSRETGIDPAEARNILEKSGRAGEIRETLLERKMMDFLASKASPSAQSTATQPRFTEKK